MPQDTFDSKEYPDVIFGHYCLITSALAQSKIETNLADNSACASLADAQQWRYPPPDTIYDVILENICSR